MKKLNNTEMYLEMYTNVSLRKLAVETGCTYGLVLKAARKPIEGELYDPNAINYEALDAYFDRREVDLSALDWEELNKPTSRVGEATISKDIDTYEIGTKWFLRGEDEKSYEVVYKTETHVVILKEDDTEPHAMKFTTFLAKGPMSEPRVETGEA